MERTSIFWFRKDLRLNDNEALSVAMAESDYVLPVYCVDPLDYGKTSSGIERTGPARASFILECAANLRRNLRARGSDLVVRVGKPVEVLVTLSKAVGAVALYAHQEVSHEEIEEETEVAAALHEEGIETRFFWAGTLIHIDDIPVKLEQMPTTFCGFRQLVQNVVLRQPVDAPQTFKGLPRDREVNPGDIPTLEELSVQLAEPQDQYVADGPPFVGGEEEALQILRDLCLDDPGQVISESGEDGIGDGRHAANLCNNMSPWLAIGCLSPRQMYEEVKNSGRLPSVSLAHDNVLNILMSELLWRDFLRFVTKTYVLIEKDSDAATVAAASH